MEPSAGALSSQVSSRPVPGLERIFVRANRYSVIAVVGVIIAAGVFTSLCGCSSPPTPDKRVQGVVTPAPWDRSTPEAAVRSYLDWTTYAYRMVNSDLATQTMSAEEEVRVSSYVQLNKEAGKLINQRLVSLDFGKASKEATRSLVPTRESWEYSYLSIGALKSLTPTYTASYEVTYTVISPKKGIWVVDSVAAKPLGEVK
jgi:hypothetical protein